MIHAARRLRLERLEKLNRNLIFDTAVALTADARPAQSVMGKRVVIGLSGQAGAGKDTIADYLVSSWGFSKVSFAGPLKKAVSSLFAISDRDMEDRVIKEQVIEQWGKSPRQLNQWLGTEVMRKQMDIDFFLKRMDISVGYEDLVVISDVRFDNEAEYVKKKWGGVIWNVSAPGRTQKNMSSDTKTHETESGISKSLIDREIDNDGDLQFTNYQVDNHLSDVLPLP